MFFSPLSKLATEIIRDVDYALTSSAASCLKSMIMHAAKQTQALEKNVGTKKEKRLSDTELILMSATTVARNASALNELCRVTGADVAGGFRVMMALHFAADKFAVRHRLGDFNDKLKNWNSGTVK